MKTKLKPTTGSIGLAMVLSLGLLGCSVNNQSRSGGQVSEGTREIVRADWDDTKSAVEVAAGQSELAIVAEAGYGIEAAEAVKVPARRVWIDLVTGGDEPVRVEFRALGVGDPCDIEVFVRVGRYGDAERERAILGRLKQRLEDLRGKDWAPVRGS